MNWKDLGEKIASAAPMIGTLVGGPPGAAVGAMVASAFGVQNTPDEINAAIEADPQAALKLRELEDNRQVELQKLLMADQQSQREEKTKRLADTNATMRAELSADSTFKSGWRPTIGYVMAANFLILGVADGVGLVYALMRDPAQVAVMASIIMTQIGAMAAVLGVNIGRRSADKQTQLTGQAQPGPLARLAHGITGKSGSTP